MVNIPKVICEWLPDYHGNHILIILGIFILSYFQVKLELENLAGSGGQKISVLLFATTMTGPRN
jgi:hypothetical protein